MLCRDVCFGCRFSRLGCQGLAVQGGSWRPRGLSKWVISRVISTLNGVTLIITLPITDLLRTRGLQVGILRDSGVEIGLQICRAQLGFARD